jgi:hypothetical protein
VLQGRAAIAATGHLWKGDTTLLDDLADALAEALALGRFVAIHIDGDVAFADRSKPPQWPHQRDVERVLLPAIRQRLGTRADEALSRLLFVVPHYSVESWLHHNRGEVEKRAPEALSWLDAHASQPGSFDAIAKIKDVSPLGARWNAELAATWTNAVAATALARSPSLAACVADLRANHVFVSALALTRG